ncbi:MAG: alpha/beta hydrolase [Caulobacterales bacterium]|nr:alpha/beta hydrolase [Caulobacterales bacterium]MCA0372752.1 alpha/beta hydrolase [Pseudomonadota bacterium]
MESSSKFAIIVAIAVTILSANHSRADEIKQAAPIVQTNYSYEDDAIVVKTIGKGKDIVLIPGLGSAAEVYDGIIPELAKKNRVHIVQLKGYAGLKLTKEEGSIFENAQVSIANYIKNKKLKTPTLIGHSMGGELSMAINARNPNLVSKVLIVDALTFYSLLFSPQATPQIMEPQAKAFANMIKGQSAEQYETNQKTAIARLVTSPEKQKLVLDWSINSNRYAIAQGVQDLMTIDLRPELKNSKIPMTLIYGYDAKMGLSVEQVDNLYKNAYKDVPNMSLKRIDNSLHFIMYDQPAEFSKAVNEFLK